MSIQHINSIRNRLSLRPPQRDSLDILARVCEIIELSKDADPVPALAERAGLLRALRLALRSLFADSKPVPPEK